MSKKIAIVNTELRMLNLNHMNLKPGTNFVDAKLFEKELPTCKAMIDAGMIELQDDSTEEENADQTDLKSYSVRKGKQLVEVTTDEEILKGWLKVEDRSTLITAIEVQLEKLNAAIKPKKEK